MIEFKQDEMIEFWCVLTGEEERENIVACGTLMPICFRLSGPRMQLAIARLNKDWVDGEQRLGGYRDGFEV